MQCFEGLRSEINQSFYFCVMNSNLPSPVGILGFGVEGQSTLLWLRGQGIDDIVILDQKEVVVPGVSSFGGANYLDGLKDCATVVRSAGVNPMLPELLRFQMNGGLVTSQVELFLERTQSKLVVGVTGTLGKGTCVTMLEHILKDAGKSCIIGGNYGVAALDLLADETPERITLLELSSFQLMTLSRPVQIAIVLKTTSEHLDWHRSVEEYRDAKANLVRYQKSQDLCIYFDDSEGSCEIAAQGRARKLRFGKGPACSAVITSSSLTLGAETLQLADCKVPGAHQFENMAAATLAAWSLGVPVADCFNSLKQYSGLTFRLENKGTHKGITFFNDSYATRPEATLAAAISMNQSFSLILGGSEKNADFTELCQELSKLDPLHSIALIGQTAERLATSLETAGYKGHMTIFATLEDAFAWSCKERKDGGAVLLSPACASFGLFSNYKERGKRFNELVSLF